MGLCTFGVKANQNKRDLRGNGETQLLIYPPPPPPPPFPSDSTKSTTPTTPDIIYSARWSRGGKRLEKCPWITKDDEECFWEGWNGAEASSTVIIIYRDGSISQDVYDQKKARTASDIRATRPTSNCLNEGIYGCYCEQYNKVHGISNTIQQTADGHSMTELDEHFATLCSPHQLDKIPHQPPTNSWPPNLSETCGMCFERFFHETADVWFFAVPWQPKKVTGPQRWSYGNAWVGQSVEVPIEHGNTVGGEKIVSRRIVTWAGGVLAFEDVWLEMASSRGLKDEAQAGFPRSGRGGLMPRWLSKGLLPLSGLKWVSWHLNYPFGQH